MELEEDRSFSDQSPGHFRAKFLDDEVMFLVLLVPADLSGLSDTLRTRSHSSAFLLNRFEIGHNLVRPTA